MATRNWMTQNTPGMLEYLSGDPNAPGYRDDHGGTANYHDHLAFKDRDTTLRVKKALEDEGIQVRGFGDRSGHAENSYHYHDQAIDIPGAQWGGSGAIGAKEYGGSSRVRQIVQRVLGGKGGSGGGGAPASSGGAESAPAPGATGLDALPANVQQLLLDVMKPSAVAFRPPQTQMPQDRAQGSSFTDPTGGSSTSPYAQAMQARPGQAPARASLTELAGLSPGQGADFNGVDRGALNGLRGPKPKSDPMAALAGLFS